MRILVEGILIYQLSLIKIFKSFELSSCKPVTVNDDDDVHSLFCKGEAGIGKTTFVKKLALDWSNGKIPELLEYHFLFVIPLRDVRDDRSLEELIVQHHVGLSANEVNPRSLINLIKGKMGNVLLNFLSKFSDLSRNVSAYLIPINIFLKLYHIQSLISLTIQMFVVFVQYFVGIRG